jgi:opacity protein-like surface antigen
MKRNKSFILSALLGLSTSLVAADSIKLTPFIGLDVNSINLDNIDNTYKEVGSTPEQGKFDSGKDTSLGFKIGSYINDSQRIYISYLSAKDNILNDNEYITHDLEYNIALNYDYIFTNLNFYDLKPYVGLNIGYSKLSLSTATTDTDFSSGLDDSSINYGLQTGLIYPINNNFDLELGIAYTKLGLSNDAIFANKPATFEWELDHMMKYSFGVSYKF